MIWIIGYLMGFIFMNALANIAMCKVQRGIAMNDIMAIHIMAMIWPFSLGATIILFVYNKIVQIRYSFRTNKNP